MTRYACNAGKFSVRFMIPFVGRAQEVEGKTDEVQKAVRFKLSQMRAELLGSFPDFKFDIVFEG